MKSINNFNISIIICLIVLFPVSLFGKEWKVEEKRIPFNCDCMLAKSEIMVGLKGDCAGNQFIPTDKANDNSNRGRISYVISTWQQFDQFKKNYFKAQYFNKISKSFFKYNNLGVVFVTYTGSLFIHNEKLYGSKHKCGFSYEIWDQKLDAVPACIWSILYIVKLKK